jgi:hypothetical protein
MPSVSTAMKMMPSTDRRISTQRSASMSDLASLLSVTLIL